MASVQMKSMSPSENFESYPPLFRQTNSPYPSHEHEEEEEEEDDDEATKQVLVESDPLPVIDFECINQEKERLHEACADWGIFRLVNHGIPPSLLNQLHDSAKKVFDLSFESKQGLFSSPITYFWGTPALNSNGVALQQAKNVNWMEGFNVPLSQLSGQLNSREEDDDESLPSSFGSLSDFCRFLLEEYGNHQARVAGTMYKVMAEMLNLRKRSTPEESITCFSSSSSSSYLSLSTGILRAYRYPPCPVTNQTWGMDVHTDSSILTILSQDQFIGGLQFYKDSTWLHVQPIPNTLIVNLGDMMQAISDDKYMSVKHRVRVNKYKERLSVGYFVFPDEDRLIQSSSYKPFSYSDFRGQVQQDLKTVGFKVGLQRFRLPC